MPAFLLILSSVLRSVKTSSVAWLLAIAIAAAAAVRAVDLLWRRMESSPTGRAKWIWATDDVKIPHPVKFSASRAFVLDRQLGEARAHIFVDRSYRLFLDGALLGGGTKRPGDGMDEYDLAGRFTAGRHDLVIEAESPTGIGGILFGLDLTGLGRNFIVSDDKWTVDGHRPFVWGMPPIYPWEFPERRRVDSASRAATQ
jgi:hypothetical protein